MKEWGVFAVGRGIWSDPDFAPEPFTEREAMMWLVAGAAWKPVSIGFNGRVVPLERGEFCFALRFLAEKWDWSKSRVERFLRKLKKRDIIRDDIRDAITVYKIKNYNTYQRVGTKKRDDIRDDSWDDSGTTSGRHRDKEETFKQSNTKIEEESISAKVASPVADAPLVDAPKPDVPKPAKPRPNLNGHAGDFQAFYSAYPLHKARRAAEKAYISAIKRAAPEVILSGAQRYAHDPTRKPEFTKQPATWLNADCWLDEGAENSAIPTPVDFAALNRKNDNG